MQSGLLEQQFAHGVDTGFAAERQKALEQLRGQVSIPRRGVTIVEAHPVTFAEVVEPVLTTLVRQVVIGSLFQSFCETCRIDRLIEQAYTIITRKDTPHHGDIIICMVRNQDRITDIVQESKRRIGLVGSFVEILSQQAMDADGLTTSDCILTDQQLERIADRNHFPCHPYRSDGDDPVVHDIKPARLGIENHEARLGKRPVPRQGPAEEPQVAADRLR